MLRTRTHYTVMLMLAVLSALVLAPMHIRAEGDVDEQGIGTIDELQQAEVYPVGLTDTYGVNLHNYRINDPERPEIYSSPAINLAFYTRYISQTRLKVVRLSSGYFDANDLTALYNAGARVFYIGTQECATSNLSANLREHIVYKNRATAVGQSIFDWVKSKESLGRYSKSTKPNGIIVYLEIGNEPNANFVPSPGRDAPCPGWNPTDYYNQLVFAYSDLAIQGASLGVNYKSGSTLVPSTLTSPVMDWIYAQPQTFDVAGVEVGGSDFDLFLSRAVALQGFQLINVPSHEFDGTRPRGIRTMGYKGVAFHAYDGSCTPNWSQNPRIGRVNQLVAHPNVRTVHLNEANVVANCSASTRAIAFKDLMNYYYSQRAKVPWVTFFFADDLPDPWFPNQQISLATSCYMTRTGYNPNTDSCT